MVLIAVHVTPKSGKDQVLGLVAGEVRCKVTAPPDNGKANKALCRLVAASIGVPKSTVEVVGGHTSRHKRLRVSGDDALVDAWMLSLPVLD